MSRRRLKLRQRLDIGIAIRKQFAVFNLRQKRISSSTAVMLTEDDTLTKPTIRWGTHLYMSLFPFVHPVCPLFCAPYLRNCRSFDHNFWCTCVK